MKEWTQIEDKTTKAFLHKFEQEVIHVIKTGFEDMFIVVHEDCHEMTLGNTFTGTKVQVEKKYNIKL